MSVEVQTVLNEMRLIVRDENAKILDRLEPRLREVELRLAEYKSQTETNKRVEETLDRLTVKIETLENWRWTMVGAASGISILFGIIGSFITKLF